MKHRIVRILIIVSSEKDVPILKSILGNEYYIVRKYSCIIIMLI